jgi:hypothetical protein
VTLKEILLPMRGIVDDHAVLYHDKTGKVRARHDKFGLHIEAGYAWNGCSPKRWYPVLGWVGTPDFECTRLASLCHDVGYQFGATEHFPLTKYTVDATFYHCIHMAGDRDIAAIYHGAVDRYGKWPPTPRDGEYSSIE